MTGSSGRSVHVVASINEGIGGPAVSVTRLAQALCRNGQQASILTMDFPEHGAAVDAAGVEVVSVPAGRIARPIRGYSRAFALALDRHAGRGARIVHNHGLWMYPNLCARRTALHHRIPLVISPRGMLEPWSLGRARIKKFLAWHAFERRNLSAARAFHATSTDELASIRSAGFRQPVAMIPNGVTVPGPGAGPSRSVLETRFPELAGKRWLLFLSRIHPKKGLEDLIEAWGGLAGEFGDVHLVIAGPDAANHRALLEGRVREAGLERQTTFTGVLGGRDKACALSNSDLLVLPTLSENFGNAVAEALAHGTPVVTTTAAPWRQIAEQGCGWWIEPGAASLHAALGESLRLPESRRREMGNRGRDLMLREYSWESVASRMAQAYEWICSGGPKPGFVLES